MSYRVEIYNDETGSGRYTPSIHTNVQDAFNEAAVIRQTVDLTNKLSGVYLTVVVYDSARDVTLDVPTAFEFETQETF